MKRVAGNKSQENLKTTLVGFMPSDCADSSFTSLCCFEKKKKMFSSMPYSQRSSRYRQGGPHISASRHDIF